MGNGIVVHISLCDKWVAMSRQHQDALATQTECFLSVPVLRKASQYVVDLNCDLTQSCSDLNYVMNMPNTFSGVAETA